MRHAALLMLLAVLAGPLASAQTFTDSLVTTDDTISTGEFADTFMITMDPGRTLVADLRSTAFDTYLILIDPSGEQVENDDWVEDDYDHSRIELSDVAAGDWSVIVTSYDVGETGPYTLVIESEPVGGSGSVRPPLPAPSQINTPEPAPISVPDALRGTARIVPSEGGYGWVVGSGSQASAEEEAARYRDQGYRAAMVPGRSNGRTVYRIVIGQFSTREAAEAARPRLPADTPRDAWILAFGG